MLQLSVLFSYICLLFVFFISFFIMFTFKKILEHVVVVQLLSRVQLFVTSWTVAPQASLYFAISWSLLILPSFEPVMPSNHLILCCPLLFLLSPFPPSGSSPMSQFFTSGGKILEFQLQLQSLQRIFRTDFL